MYANKGKQLRQIYDDVQLNSKIHVVSKNHPKTPINWNISIFNFDTGIYEAH